MLNAIAPSEAERIAAESLIENHLNKMSITELRAAGGEEDRDQLRLRVFAEVRGGAEDDKAKEGGEEAADQRAVRY